MKRIKKLLVISCLFQTFYGIDLSSQDYQGRTPLMNAISQGNKQLALSYISQMSQPEFNKQDSSGNTALMLVLQYNPQQQYDPWRMPVPNEGIMGGMVPSDIIEEEQNMMEQQEDQSEQAMTQPMLFRHKRHHGRGSLFQMRHQEQPATFYTIVAQALINSMDQIGLNLQDHWGNTALIWTTKGINEVGGQISNFFDRHHPEIALMLIPKMSHSGLLLKDLEGKTALDRIQAGSQWRKFAWFDNTWTQVTQMLQNAIQHPSSVSQSGAPVNTKQNPNNTTVATSQIDIVEARFGDYLDPFALPPAQAMVKNVIASKEGFKNQNLTGADLSNHDWSNTDFTGANLTKADFSNSILTNANFTGTNLQGANFENCNISAQQLASAQTIMEAWFGQNNQLQNTNFTGKILTGCSFGNCNLTGAIFDHASLQGTDFTNANLTGASFKFSQFDATTLFESSILDKADFTNSSFTFSQLQQALSYAYITLAGCNFSQQNLKGINFSRCNLTGINLTGSDCSFANFSRAIMSGTELSVTSSLESANLSFLTLDNMQYNNKSLARAYIRGSSLRNINFQGTTLDGIVIINSDLTGAQLQGVSMKKPLILNSTFTNASFSTNPMHSSVDVDLTTCNLTGTTFEFPNLSPSFFDDKTLQDIQLRQVFGPNILAQGNTWSSSLLKKSPYLNLSTTKNHLIFFPIDSSSLDSYTYITPKEWKNNALAGVSFYSMCYLNPKTNTQSVPQSIALIVTPDYPESKLSLTTQCGRITSGTFNPWGLVEFDLYFKTPVTLSKLNNDNSNKDFSTQNLSSQVLAGDIFHNCNFSHSNLKSAYMRGSDFTGANFSHANLNQADIKNSIFTNANCSHAVMWAIMTDTNFTNAILDHASFAWSTGFTGTQLMQAQKSHPGINLQALENLQHCTFSGRDFSQGNISGANLSFSTCDNCNFSSVSATYAICTNTNFQESDLSQAVFDQANLVQADFRGANLNKTSLRGADLRKAIFSSHDQLQHALIDQSTRLDKVLNIK